MEKKVDVDLDKKITLTVEEASRLSGIGVNTIRRMMENPSYDFVLWVGKHRKVKRTAFEELINNATFIDD